MAQNIFEAHPAEYRAATTRLGPGKGVGSCNARETLTKNSNVNNPCQKMTMTDGQVRRQCKF